MTLPEPLRLTDELYAWDWRAELERQERSIAWLARQTNRSASWLYKIAEGRERASLQWLEAAARVLGKAIPS